MRKSEKENNGVGRELATANHKSAYLEFELKETDKYLKVQM
jgi:hypothetical protein